MVGLVLAAGLLHAQEPGLARGAALLAPFKTELQEALRTGLAQGTVEAIAACQIRAPAISQALSRDDIRVGRSSDRLRNPANIPPQWVDSILETYIARNSDRSPRIVALTDKRSGYVEPILVQPLCLTCHGEALVPGVALQINELYPEDRAVGYRVGDLRGVFWVEFPTVE